MSETNRFAALPGSPFPRLNALLDGIAPGRPPMLMSLGEPQHPFPEFVTRVLAENAAGFGKYPPIAGTEAFREAAAGWLERRFALPAGTLDRETQILPANGTREALFHLAQVAVPTEKAGERPTILMPNPFYQCYAAAALAAGAEPVYVSATAESGHLPDYEALPEELLARTAVIYFCSPANPQGAVASRDYLERIIAMAQEHDFVLAMDECYADIYDREAPVGALEICAAQGGARESNGW